MKAKFSSSLSLTLLVLGTSTLLALGCKPGPKSDELVELERMLQDPQAAQVRDTPGASRFFQEARQFRRLSLEAHGERKEEISQEYAILGTLRYRTALAVATQHEARERLEAANALVEGINPKLQAVNSERNKMAQELQDLEQRIAVAVRERERRERELPGGVQGGFEPAQQGPGTGGRPALSAVNDRIRQAEQARATAQSVEAEKYSRTIFEQAESQLRTARDLVNSSPAATDLSMQRAEHALSLFQQAHSAAEPQFKEFQRKMLPENRIASLRREAEDNFGGPFTFTEYNGVRIIMARLFLPRTADFQPNTDAWLNELVRLLKEYQEFSITIEGFTQRGGPGATQNLATSQLRAHQVRDYLTGRGIAPGRITTEGFGQDRIRYSDSAESNDRVEIILRYSNQ
jgi:outer membrane protein OmpA-like peptidoglycan-associated protein